MARGWWRGGGGGGEAGGVVVVGGGIGGGGIRGGGWDVSPFSWVWGMHLPTAVVCLSTLVAHLEPVASAWCSGGRGAT